MRSKTDKATSSFFLNLWTLLELCVICMPFDGFQATVFTKATTATKTDLCPRVPGGIPMTAFFIPAYQPSFSQTCFKSCPPTRCREGKKEAQMERKGQNFRRPLERKSTRRSAVAHQNINFDHRRPPSKHNPQALDPDPKARSGWGFKMTSLTPDTTP